MFISLKTMTVFWEHVHPEVPQSKGVSRWINLIKQSEGTGRAGSKLRDVGQNLAQITKGKIHQ